MSLTISQHTEALLTEEARRQGISVDALLERLITERAKTMAGRQPEGVELPVWHLGASGSFRRRDIYEGLRGASRSAT